MAGSVAPKPLHYSDDALNGQPSFLATIARELSKVVSGTTAEHLSGAKRLLKEAFRTVERADRTTSDASVPTSSNERLRGEGSVVDATAPGRTANLPGDRLAEVVSVRSQTTTLHTGGSRCLLGSAVA